MRGNRWDLIAVPALAVAFISGCQNSGSKRPATVISPAPAVSDAGAEPDGVVAEKTITTAPVKTASFADRHPLFSRPRQYWENTGDSKVVRAAKATFIGVPSGFVGEVKQIFVRRAHRDLLERLTNALRTGGAPHPTPLPAAAGRGRPLSRAAAPSSLGGGKTIPFSPPGRRCPKGG